MLPSKSSSDTVLQTQITLANLPSTHRLKLLSIYSNLFFWLWTDMCDGIIYQWSAVIRLTQLFSWMHRVNKDTVGLIPVVLLRLYIKVKGGVWERKREQAVGHVCVCVFCVWPRVKVFVSVFCVWSRVKVYVCVCVCVCVREGDCQRDNMGVFMCTRGR